MPTKKAGNKTGHEKGHTSNWEQPWVLRVKHGKYSIFEKFLFVRVTSFGKPGCWMTNRVLMAEFNVSERYIRHAITRLWEGGELIITGWNGHGRVIYAAHNPEVLTAMNQRYENDKREGKVVDKADYQLKKRFRGYVTRNNDAGNPEQECREPGTGVPGTRNRSAGNPEQ